jgi:3'-phosphoadenosine 5'-phosphosulfate sulfotransferase (PAPS reductase)/FAD synthetase
LCFADEIIRQNNAGSRAIPILTEPVFERKKKLVPGKKVSPLLDWTKFDN